MRNPITINQGDTVHHPHHGIGLVESIAMMSFSGEPETRFAKLYFEREKLTLMLRTKDLEGTVRNPIGKNKAKEILDHLESFDGNMSSQWKARANANQEALERGNARDYAEVYKGLSQLEAEGTLRASDRAHLNQSLELLSEELANALNKTPAQARKLIVNV